MRVRNLITVINGATWLQLLLLVLVQWNIENVNGLSQAPSTDPCEASPCGKGAECKSMGSIAICVCPNNDKGDPFVACMKEAYEPELAKPSSSSAPNSASVHHQARATPQAVSTPKPNTTPPTKKVSLITSSTTPSPSTSTTSTTRSPYVHVYQTTSSRPSSSSSGHFGYSHDNQNPSSNQNNQLGDPNNIIPESHRIPIINNSPSNGYYPQHHERPRPINGDSLTSTPSIYNPYRGHSSSSYDIFNEKTAGSPEYGITNSYPYRGSTSSGHYSGGQSVYEYDTRPIAYPHYPQSSNVNRFGHHSYHPTTSGFPAPITESSASRYSHTGPITGGSTYDIYNFNPVRNDILGAHSSGTRIVDALGKYENCRMINGYVACADNTNSFPYNHDQYQSHYTPRGEYLPTSTAHYGFNVNRDRDHYSSYYPARHTSPATYDYTSYNHRQSYPEHGTRYPIDTTERYHHPFHAMEQKVNSQTVISITPSASISTSMDPKCEGMCGINSVCRLVLNRPVCGCPESHTGDPSVRCDPVQESSGRGMRRDKNSVQCERHVECKETEICAKNECIDPCQHQDQIVAGSSNVKIAGDAKYKTSICGSNAECLVVGHTPVCKCNQNYFGNPYVACVP